MQQTNRTSHTVRLRRRVQVNAICLLRAAGCVPINEPAINISVSGLLMRSRFVLKAGLPCEVVIAFSELGGHQTLSLAARVVRSDETHTALEFTALTPEQRAYLKAVVDAHPIDAEPVSTGR